VFNIVCVLKSGGIYDAEWVRKLKDACSRHAGKHRFTCLSDVNVPCETIPLKHDWPAWWSKIELFRVVEPNTLYLDLDTVVCGKVDVDILRGVDFAMLRNFWRDDMVGSGVMWFGDKIPRHVYDKFVKQPEAYISHHERNADGPYVGDQAFIWDALDRNVETLNDLLPGIYSYKMHCKAFLPNDASIVCFHGKPRPTEVDTLWMKEHWS